MSPISMTDPGDELVARMCQSATEQNILANEFLKQANRDLDKAQYHADLASIRLARAKTLMPHD